MREKGGKRLARGESSASGGSGTGRRDGAGRSQAEHPGRGGHRITASSGSAAEQSGGQQSLGRRLWNDYGYLVITAAVMVLLLRVLLQLIYVPTGSMETTIPTRSLVLGWRLPYVVADPVPDRGDIVTFWNDEEGEVLVKRVIGLPGETVSFADGCVYIDGERLQEEYLPEGVSTTCEKTFQVPEGCMFVMGDNREGSKDSRLLKEPYIPVDSIQGRMLVAISIGSGQSWQGIRWIG